MEAKVRTGLVSITFRELDTSEIIQLVAKAGLDGIEWGGDVHVPHGDLETARKVAKSTADAGLQVSSYGSYYRVAESPAEGLVFEEVLASTIELGAPVVRVWAGRKGSGKADGEYRKCVSDELRQIGEMAARQNIVVACEYHGNTLTDTDESAEKLIRETAHENVMLYWQPHNNDDDETRMRGLKQNLHKILVLHVFCWRQAEKGVDRRPLAEGADAWRQYFDVFSRVRPDGWALLEFVKDDSPEAFIADAATLKALAGVV